jgi:predicted DNA-binding transcriptional regulator AlpA
MTEPVGVEEIFKSRGLNSMPPDVECFLSKSEVSRLVGMSERTLQSMMSSGEFPKPDRYIGPRPKWLKSTYNQWARTRPAKKGG